MYLTVSNNRHQKFADTTLVNTKKQQSLVIIANSIQSKFDKINSCVSPALSKHKCQRYLLLVVVTLVLLFNSTTRLKIHTITKKRRKKRKNTPLQPAGNQLTSSISQLRFMHTCLGMAATFFLSFEKKGAGNNCSN